MGGDAELSLVEVLAEQHGRATAFLEAARLLTGLARGCLAAGDRAGARVLAGLSDEFGRRSAAAVAAGRERMAEGA